MKADVEFARLLHYAETDPETQIALMRFFRACEGLTRKELADVFERAALYLREHYPEIY